jgi:surfactin family lipopeptide synthetase A
MDFPVSFAQERLWPADRARCRGWWLDGPLDVDALQHALDALVARHGALRTSIVTVDGTPRQVIADEATVTVERVEDPRPELVAAECAHRPFDPTRGPLLRATLVHTGPDRHLLVLAVHHLVCDDTGLAIVLSELSTLYDGRTGLAEQWMDYADYAEWQRERLRGEELDRLLRYWVGHLRGAPDLRAVPIPESGRSASEQARTATLGAATLGAATVGALAELAERHGTTVPVAVLTGFAVVLSRYGRQPEVVIATVASGRTHAELERIVGVFANPVALRISLAGNPSFLDQLVRVRDAGLAALAHQELPFGLLVEELAAHRRPEAPSLVRVGFVEEPDATPDLQLPGVTARPLDLGAPPATDADLTLHAACRADGATLTLAYRTGCCDADLADRLLRCVVRLLETAAVEPDISWSEHGVDADDELTSWIAAPAQRVPVDRPAPVRTAAPATKGAVKPDGAVEAAVAGIWGELLPDATLQPSDNLFSRGANSLTAMRFLVRVAERFGVELDLHHVFDQPTIAELAPAVAALVQDAASASG